MSPNPQSPNSRNNPTRKSQRRVAGRGRDGAPLSPNVSSSPAASPAGPVSVRPGQPQPPVSPPPPDSTPGWAYPGGGSTPPRRGRGPVSRLAVFLLGLAVVCAIVAILGALHPGADRDPNRAFVDEAATTELTAQARDKVCVMFAADATDKSKLDEWAARTRAALTGQALEEFDEYLPANTEILTQTKTLNECRADAIGVADLTGGDDGDTARLVVNLLISESANGQATNSLAPRAQFSMVKRGDQWLVEKIEAF